MSEVKDQIKENMGYAKQIFEERIADATDFINKEAELGFIQENFGVTCSIPEEAAIEVMRKHPFVRWLRKNTDFKIAVNLINENKLRLIQRTKIEIIKLYLKEFALERLCAIQVYSFPKNINSLEQVIVTQDKRKRVVAAMKKLDFELNHGGFYIENGAKQLVLHKLLKELIKSSGHNVFSSRKKHPWVARQVFMKLFLQGLFRTYHNITDELAVKLTLNVSNIFFKNEMDKRDAEVEARNVLNEVLKENEFLKHTAMEILLGHTENL